MRAFILFFTFLNLLTLNAFAECSCQVKGQFYTNGATYTVGDEVYLKKDNFEFTAAKITAIDCNTGSLFTTKITVKVGSQKKVMKPSEVYYITGCDGDGVKEVCVGSMMRFFTFMPRSNMSDGHVDGEVVAFSALIAVIRLRDGSYDFFTKDSAFP